MPSNAGCGIIGFSNGLEERNMTEKINCPYCGIIGTLDERRCLSCGAPFSIPTGPEEEDLLGQNLVDQIRDACTAYEEIESCHIKETIPERKLENAKAAFEIAEEDDVILVYDGTVFGNNKLGFAICKSGIYWKNDWTTPTKRTYLDWNEYKERNIKKKKKDFHISLGQGDKIAIVDEEDINDLSDLLKDIQDLFW
jgi:hypothetical protein